MQGFYNVILKVPSWIKRTCVQGLLAVWQNKKHSFMHFGLNIGKKRKVREQRGSQWWVTVLYLYQPVCQSSTLLQRRHRKEQEDEKKR